MSCTEVVDTSLPKFVMTTKMICGVLRCGHCKHLTPEYKKLGEAVAKDPKLKNSVVIAKVADDFLSTKTCQRALVLQHETVFHGVMVCFLHFLHFLRMRVY